MELEKGCGGGGGGGELTNGTSLTDLLSSACHDRNIVDK